MLINQTIYFIGIGNRKVYKIMHMLKCDPDIADKTLYVCSYCRLILNNNKILNRCILNGLINEPVPDELMKLNALERQLIQKAKVFQTVVRLGTYTGKVPVYNALKALKGTLFFLPLPIDKTFRIRLPVHRSMLVARP